MPSVSAFLDEKDDAPSASDFLDEEPKVTVTQPEGGNGFLAKVNAALRKPSPYEGLRNFEESTRENIMAMAPHDLTSYLESIYPAAGAARHAVDLGRQLLHGDVSGIPLVGRGPEIVAADETPAFSKERFGTAERTVMDLLTLAGAGGGPRVPLRAEPLVPEPPPTQNMGPGTIAGDVSRALERRFTLQEPPPEPPPPVEVQQPWPKGFSATMREPWQTPPEPPVQAPEIPVNAPEAAVPTGVRENWQKPFPEFLSEQSKASGAYANPLGIESAWVSQVSDAIKSGQPVPPEVRASNMDVRFDEQGNPFHTGAAERNGQILAKRQELLTRQKDLKQRFIAGDHGVAPELEAVEAQINDPVTNPVVHAPVEQRVQHGQFAKPGYTAVDTPPEPPVNAPGGAALAPEAPSGVPGAGVIDRTHSEQFRDASGAIDSGQFSDSVAAQVGGALARGDSVTFVTDGGRKSVPITSVNRGMMADAQGQRWGALSILTDARERVEITPKSGVPVAEPVTSTPALEIPEADRPYAGEQPTPGIANRVLKEQIKAGTLPEEALVQGKGTTPEIATARARAAVAKDPNVAFEAARRVHRGEMHPDDPAILHAYNDQLAEGAAQAAKASIENPGNIPLKGAADATEAAHMDFLQNVLPKAKGQAQRTLVGFQGATPPDYATYAGMLKELGDFNEGKGLTRAQRMQLYKRGLKGERLKAQTDAGLDKMQKTMDRTMPKTKTPNQTEMRSMMEDFVEKVTPCE